MTNIDYYTGFTDSVKRFFKIRFFIYDIAFSTIKVHFAIQTECFVRRGSVSNLPRKGRTAPAPFHIRGRSFAAKPHSVLRAPDLTHLLQAVNTLVRPAIYRVFPPDTDHIFQR